MRNIVEGSGGDILVNGSARLVTTLMENDLVDEHRLMVFPVLLGAGKRLFNDAGPPATLRLAPGEAGRLRGRPRARLRAGRREAAGRDARGEKSGSEEHAGEVIAQETNGAAALGPAPCSSKTPTTS